MTQGAPRKTRTTPAKPAETSVVNNSIPTSNELDLDAWLSKRGLLNERRVKVNGQSFRFTAAATGEQIIAYNAAINEGSLAESLATLLVDPGEKDELAEAFKIQRQPITAALEQEYFAAIINYVIAGEVASDMGESSAS